MKLLRHELESSALYSLSSMSFWNAKSFGHFICKNTLRKYTQAALLLKFHTSKVEVLNLKHSRDIATFVPRGWGWGVIERISESSFISIVVRCDNAALTTKKT